MQKNSKKIKHSGAGMLLMKKKWNVCDPINLATKSSSTGKYNWKNFSECAWQSVIDGIEISGQERMGIGELPSKYLRNNCQKKTN